MPKISELPAGTTVTGAEKLAAVQNGVTVELTASQLQAGVTGVPIVILCTGQSNFVQRPSQAWTPATNIHSWNYTDVDGNIGTAYTTVPSTSINLPEAIASFIANEFPSRPVYVISIAIGSQDISHWMAGASAPDMYANITANITPALTAAGATKIDYFFWWQGENQTTSPELYPANFDTVMARFKLETWFPRATPVTIFGIAPSTISGAVSTDTINGSLQECVRREPDVRRMVYSGTLGASYWSDTLHPNGVGFYALGQLGAVAALHGETHLPDMNPISRGTNIPGRGTYRNLIRDGDMTVNPWRSGTSFSSVANGTALIDNFTWVQSGAGVVDIFKTADAPTVAQAGIFTQHCLHVDVTTADAAIAGVDYYGIQGTISGLDSSFLGLGQTGAKAVTVSFWVKSTITGNYFVAIENSAQNRSYCSQYTVNAADTWEFKRVVFSGDLTGTWLYTSGIGLRVLWTVSSSDTYLFTPDVWNAGDVRVGNATRANGMSSTANNFKLALLQVEEGAYQTAFDRTPATLSTAYQGSTSGTTTVVPSAVASGTLTLPAGTDTLVGRATTDTLTNKTITGGTLNFPAINASDNTFVITGSVDPSKRVFIEVDGLTTATDRVLTVPDANLTIVGTATTQTLTNKTFDSAGTGNVLKVSGVTVSAGQYPGETTTGSATAGNVGELISSAIAQGAAVALTTNTALNVTSMSLTAGDWEVSGYVGFQGGGTTQVAYLEGSISTTSGTPDYTVGRWNNWQAGFVTATPFASGSTVASEVGVPLIPTRISLSITTTVYLVAKSVFTTSTNNAFGIIRARRAR